MPAAFTNFCCRSGGSNLNAGTVDGSSTVPGTSPLVTYTGGDWNAATEVYTAPVGADMTEAVVDRYASVYHDGDTAPTTNQYLDGRITAVNAGTRQITLSATARCQLGTEVATGTGNRSMRIGGAWAGPSGTTTFPFNSFLSSTITNSASDPVRLNMCSDLSTVMSVALSMNGGVQYLAGFTTSYGDGGRWVLEGATAGASYVPLTASSSPTQIQDVEVKNNGASGSSNGVAASAALSLRRVVVRDIRGNGVSASQTLKAHRSEFYGCNQSNTSNLAALQCAGATTVTRCAIHDNAGSNTTGIRHTSAVNSLAVIGSVIDSNGSHGILQTSGSPPVYIGNNAFYANGGDGFRGASGFLALENNQYFDNGGYANGGAAAVGYSDKNVFGSGTMANASGNFESTRIEQSGSITYAADSTPWEDPANGDFRLVSGATTVDDEGEGSFLLTASGYGGSMVSYPPIGPTTRAVAAAGGGVQLPYDMNGGCLT